MCKRILALILVLTPCLASCDGPYAVRFQREHPAYPPADPKLAALTYPDPSGRLSYGLHRALCPGKTLKSLKKAVEFVVSSKTLKGLDEGGLAAFESFSEFLAQTLSDSLSPEALGYGGTRDAMAAAIGAALASGYSCESTEAAAAVYYDYGRDDYVAEVCGKGNSLKTVLGLLRKGSGGSRLVAVSQDPEPHPWFSDVHSRDPSVGEALYTGRIDRSAALGTLVDNLEELPACHGVTQSYVDQLRLMADRESPLFFPLYDAVEDFRRNCPLNYSGYVLDRVEGDVVFMSNGTGSFPAFKLVDGQDRWAEELPAAMEWGLEVDSPLPVDGGDVWPGPPSGNDRGISDGPAGLNMGYIALIPIAAVVVWGWARARKKDS